MKRAGGGDAGFSCETRREGRRRIPCETRGPGSTWRSATTRARGAGTAARGRRSPRPVSLPAFGGDGLRPGVDVDDSSALLDTLEGPAYLAALAIEADAEWVTSDADFERFEPDLRLELLRP